MDVISIQRFKVDGLGCNIIKEQKRKKKRIREQYISSKTGMGYEQKLMINLDVRNFELWLMVDTKLK